MPEEATFNGGKRAFIYEADEIDKVVLREDKVVEIYLRRGGVWGFKVKGFKVDKNRSFLGSYARGEALINDMSAREVLNDLDRVTPKPCQFCGRTIDTIRQYLEHAATVHSDSASKDLLNDIILLKDKGT